MYPRYTQCLGFIGGNVQFVLGIELVDDPQRAIAVANVFVDVTLERRLKATAGNIVCRCAVVG